MAEYSQKWHNGTSRTRSTKTSDGLAAIQAQLNNLGREIKKVNEKVYAAQVGCEQCKGPHYTKDCPLKEEAKTLEEAYYTQFGGPFQGGGYRAIALGFYQRNNVNPSYQEQRQSMEDTLRKFLGESAKRQEENSNLIKEIRASTDAAIRNQGASIKNLEIQIGQMSKSGEEEKIIFRSVKPASSLINRVYMLSLRETIELDLEARLIGETLMLNRSLDHLIGDYIELNDLNEPLELRRDQVDDLMATIKEGKVVEELRSRNDDRMISDII
ncbi:ribonuclease H-like domain-containing protein [Tanacetum coccineum]